jgi:predicted permease
MTTQQAFRSLKRTPVFTIAVILSLVLGVGSVGSMFAIVYGVLLAPLPYGEPQQLVSVSLQSADQGQLLQPPAIFETYKKYANLLTEVGIYRSASTNVWTEGDAAESVMATWISASMMPMLQAKPLLGRSFTEEETVRGGPDAVILSESEWRNRFNGAHDVIGKTLMVNSVRRQIIGVMPAQFSFPTNGTRVWLPAKRNANANVGDFAYAGLARLAPGATAAQLQSELAALLQRTALLFPHLESGGATATWLAEMRPTPVIRPLHEVLTSGFARTLWMLAAAAGMVLLVAWANVVNLILMRSESRQQEMGIRAALGAGWWRIVRDFLGESVLLGAISSVIALLVAFVTVRMLVAYGPADLPRLAELGVGLGTATFIALISVLGVIVCAVLPALRLHKVSLANKLDEGARGQSSGRSSQRLRASIIMLQIALALVVSVSSALLLRTAYRLSNVHPGFKASEVMTFSTQLPFARYDNADAIAFYKRLAEQVEQLPFVKAAGVTNRVPLSGGETPALPFAIEATGQARLLPVHVVDNGYFNAMRIPQLAGNQFERLAQAQSDEIIINQSAAELLFGDVSGKSALGERLLFASEPPYTVIGVVGNVRYENLATAPVALAYRPMAQANAPHLMTLVVHTSAPPDTTLSAIRKIVQAMDLSVSVFNVQAMTDVVRASTAQLSLTLTLMTCAAAISLVLGAIGLYGVMAYVVALRGREFGIRIALGAKPKTIRSGVAQLGMTLTAGGMAIGFIFYALAAPFLRAFLYGVTISDPWTLAAVTLVLIGIAALAIWIPARRAAMVDPVVALRGQ